MKRFAGLMVLMALTTPAYAGSYSFVIGGRHIHVEASRNCRSLSCVSWSETSKKRDRDDAVATAAAAAPAQTPAPPVAPAPVAAPPAPAPAPVAIQPAPSMPQPQVAVVPVQTSPVQAPPAVVSAPVQPQAAAAAPPILKPVDTRAIAVTPPAPPPVTPAVTPAAKPDVKVEAKVEPKVEPKADPKAEPKPSVGFDLGPDAKLEPKVETKAEPKVETKPETTATVTKTPAEKPQADKPAVAAKPAPSKTSLQSDGDGVEAPIGDWQTEGRKGLVRIEPCGTALCGYMINTSTNAKGETVLINMKPKANSEWSGSIYSRASGNTYYATMTIKRSNTLRVEACVVGHYFCSGNNWTRITPPKQDEMIPTREASAAEPKS